VLQDVDPIDEREAGRLENEDGQLDRCDAEQ